MLIKRKGVTLIELLITLGIVSIVLSSIYTFLFTNYNTLNSVNNDLELQSQGEKAINFMIDSIIEGYGVVEVKATDGSDVVSSTESEISKLSVKKDTYVSIFELRNGVLYYGEVALETDTNEKANKEICHSIKSIIITTLPSDRSFSNCAGLKIKITMKSGKTEKVFVNEIYMRNKEGN